MALPPLPTLAALTGLQSHFNVHVPDVRSRHLLEDLIAERARVIPVPATLGAFLSASLPSLMLQLRLARELSSHLDALNPQSQAAVLARTIISQLELELPREEDARALYPYLTDRYIRNSRTRMNLAGFFIASILTSLAVVSYDHLKGPSSVVATWRETIAVSFILFTFLMTGACMSFQHWRPRYSNCNIFRLLYLGAYVLTILVVALAALSILPKPEARNGTPFTALIIGILDAILTSYLVFRKPRYEMPY